MSELRWCESVYPLDPQGFLADAARWDTGFVEGMAELLELPDGLTVAHWKIVLHVRRTFVRQWTVPRIHETCRACHVSRTTLRSLFPSGYQRGACRLAGIPYAVIALCHYALTYETQGGSTAGRPTTPSGFLVDFQRWDQHFARQAARDCGISTLTPKHWQVIDYLRNTFAETGQLPTLRRACEETGIGLEEWILLFPNGFRNGAARCAGLPAAIR